MGYDIDCMKSENTRDNDEVGGFFHPQVWRWFIEKFQSPTDIQQRAWPVIASGRNVLLSAPTGTGKTLTVFLWALDRLIQGAWERGCISVLYISPLKALNNDIRENLRLPLEELRTRFDEKGLDFPQIKVLARSGDTPQSERQRMLRKPPEILITTPESLNLLLSSPRAREILSTIKTVILDEIHSIAAGKRGTHLITAVDRLHRICGEFQRIAVSATVRPLELVAEFVGGYRYKEKSGSFTYEKRPVEVIQSESAKCVLLEVEYPARSGLGDGFDTVWALIADRIKSIIEGHKSTLIFVNSRRLSERITQLINDEGGMQAYAHHGSLSKELRYLVETKLRTGRLSAIVATSSLEMGIDIGDLDMVVLVQTPFSVSSAVQRVGRSGHSVGKQSRGILFPSHGRDLIDAAVVSKMVNDKDVENIHPVRNPLDLLAQIIVSMVGISSWNTDELYGFLRTSYPYHELRKEEFIAVLEMLAGRYGETRIRELRSRISIDRVSNTIEAKPGALQLVYMNGGTIPDRGYFSLRLQDSRSAIGELDEEFVWERRIGDTFTLGTQNWKITRIDHQKVEVVPWKGPVQSSPFWKADGMGRDFHFSERISSFLEQWNDRLDDPALKVELERIHLLSSDAAESLVSYLREQKRVTSSDLPHRHHLLIEHSSDPSTGQELNQIFLHTLWGNRVNYPLALALSAIWEDQYFPIDVVSENDAILLTTPQLDMPEFDLVDMLGRIRPDTVEKLLEKKLEGSGFFGARFRENAGRALLLPRATIGKRMPLWLTRLKAKKLLDVVGAYKNFPIVVETWRSSIQDDFDLGTLKLLLDEIAAGSIKISEIESDSPSPFAAGTIWRTTDKHMYADDTPVTSRFSSVDESVLKEAVFRSEIRPQIDPRIVSQFVMKLQRTERDYSPRTVRELIDWVGERILIPEPEWESLLAAIVRDHGIEKNELLEAAAERIVKADLPNSQVASIVSVESLGRIVMLLPFSIADIQLTEISGGQDIEIVRGIVKTLIDGQESEEDRTDELESVLDQWLGFYGPLEIRRIRDVFGISAGEVEDALNILAAEKSVVLDSFTPVSTKREVCNAENLERLIAFTRRQNRGSFEPLSPAQLQLFLASWQRLTRRGTSAEDLKQALSALMGYPARLGSWEEDFLPARLENYQENRLDELLYTTDLEWFGCGQDTISFCFKDDFELFIDSDVKDISPAGIDRLFPDPKGKYTFWDLHERLDSTTAELTAELWQGVWKGEIRCDSYDVIRKGIMTGFKPETVKPQNSRHLHRRGSGLAGWQSKRPLSGNWYLPDPVEQPDLMEIEELNKDRVRVLLRRYGVIFRDLLRRECPALSWRLLFRVLRIMELSGEIVGGHFFSGIPGLQFASQEALRFLNEGLPDDAVYWINATDPSSLCGIDIPELKTMLPERFPSTYLVFHGSVLALVVRKRCEELEFMVDPSNPDIVRYLQIFRALIERSFNPVKSIKVKSINGVAADESPYCSALLKYGFRKEYQGLSLWSYE